jgi:hypothetical protein
LVLGDSTVFSWAGCHSRLCLYEAIEYLTCSFGDRCRFGSALGWINLHDSRSKNEDKLLQVVGKGFIPDQGWLRPGDRERGTETVKDFDSISERQQNRKTKLIHTIWRSQTEVVEHRVGDVREISSQVLDEQGRTRVFKALNSSAATNHMRLSIHDYQKLCSQWYIGGIYTRNNPPSWL